MISYAISANVDSSTLQHGWLICTGMKITYEGQAINDRRMCDRNIRKFSHFRVLHFPVTHFPVISAGCLVDRILISCSTFVPETAMKGGCITSVAELCRACSFCVWRWARLVFPSPRVRTVGF